MTFITFFYYSAFILAFFFLSNFNSYLFNRDKKKRNVGIRVLWTQCVVHVYYHTLKFKNNLSKLIIFKTLSYFHTFKKYINVTSMATQVEMFMPTQIDFIKM